MSKLTHVLLFLALSSFAACGGCGPAKAGDACDVSAEDDPCPDGLVCQQHDDGDAVCRVAVGAACDDEADDAYCADATTCTGEGDDAVCGGLHSTCDTDERACADGFTCEDVQGGDAPAQCEKPLQLAGLVIDALSEDPLPEAHVVAFDVQGTAVTRIARSKTDGTYVLDVPAVRRPDGAPIDATVTLRGSAADFQTFPGGLRTALPIHLDQAAEGDDAYTIDGALTTVALIPLPEAQRGRATVSGAVRAGKASAGVLVVAEGTEPASAVSDLDGEFTIFNVSAGDYEVQGYAAFVQLAPEPVSVADDDVADVVLEADDRATGTMTGTVQIVNATGGAVTSVVLVVASTFDEAFVRGDVPRGLRTALDVSGAWTIEGVPDGEYVILAAFENDDLVRDPDANIAGTELVRITVPEGSSRDVEVSQSFKITEALAVVSPGADLAEAVVGTPTFVFADDSSEDYYELVVYDAFGDLVWETEVPGVSGSDDVSVTYAGPALVEGMYYQFRAKSWRSSGGGTPSAISATEDLKGVFFVPSSSGG